MDPSGTHTSGTLPVKIEQQMRKLALKRVGRTGAPEKARGAGASVRDERAGDAGRCGAERCACVAVGDNLPRKTPQSGTQISEATPTPRKTAYTVTRKDSRKYPDVNPTAWEISQLRMNRKESR